MHSVDRLLIVVRLLIAGLIAGLSAVAVACTPSTGVRPIYLPTGAPYPTVLPTGVEVSGMLALAQGRLEAGDEDGHRCVWLIGSNGSRFALVWPESYRAEETGDGIVVHGDNGAVARTGENVELVGGYGGSSYDGPCGLGEPAFYVGSVRPMPSDSE